MPQNLAGSSLLVYHLCFGIVLRTGNVPAGPDGTASDVFQLRDIADEIRLDNKVKKKKRVILEKRVILNNNNKSRL